MNLKSISYYFDRIRINVYFDRSHLLSVPQLYELNRRHIVDVYDAFEKAKQGGYRSRIEVTVPTNETLNIIQWAIGECAQSVPKFSGSSDTNRFYAISKVEIARDFILDSESDAILLTNLIINMTGKKYTTSFSTFYSGNVPRNRGRQKNPELKKEIFSTRTGYWGNKNNFEFVVYGRYSKVTKLPAAHTEWRIIGASNIKKRTGIKSIDYMKEFDFKKFFEENDRKYLVYETIDHEAIGRWHKGIDGRRKLTKREKISAAITGQLFCSGQRINLPCRDKCIGYNCLSLACEITSAKALKQYLEQENIRNKKKKLLRNG